MVGDGRKLELSTPLRRFVKRIFPWTKPIYEAYSGAKTGLMPLREFDTPYGFRLVGPDCFLTNDQAEGTYESEEMSFMAGKMGQADAFIDCGANVGLYTMLALKHGLPVVAIEPQRKNLRGLRRGLKVNGFSRCRTEKVALSDRCGTTTMYGISSGSSSLIRGWNSEISAIRRTVRTTTLDNLLQSQFDGKRLLIKMDLEGHEWEALQGAAATLARVPRPVWMVEVIDFAYPGGVHPHRADIFALFERNGYAAREIAEGNWGFE
jgi:FkbM family methyltransferase